MGNREEEARLAARSIGTALAKSGWKIAVYGSSKNYIEYDVVKGYLAAELKEPKSIICIYPNGDKVNFDDMAKHIDCFDLQSDTTRDWEASFYRSIKNVDAILLFGGKQSAFIAAQIALSNNLPIVAAADFGGSSQKIWSEHLSKLPGYVDKTELQIMGHWTDNSPREFVESLNRQYKKYQKKINDENEEFVIIQNKAKLYEQLIAEQKKQKEKTKLAIIFLLLFLFCFIAGLTAPLSNWQYTIITIIGLGFAGGMGATIRMLVPQPPESGNKWNGPIIGGFVGLVFSLISLIPQLMQKPVFFLHMEMTKDTEVAMRVQFICTILVAVLAGLGFDYAIEQLIRKSQQNTSTITNNLSSIYPSITMQNSNTNRTSVMLIV